MNDDTIADLGGFCLELLGDQRFQALIELHTQSVVADILSTKADAKELRERLYHEHAGAQAFLGMISKFAETFDKLTAPPPPQDHLEVEDDPSVHNIYSTDLDNHP